MTNSFFGDEDVEDFHDFLSKALLDPESALHHTAVNLLAVCIHAESEPGCSVTLDVKPPCDHCGEPGITLSVYGQDSVLNVFASDMCELAFGLEEDMDDPEAWVSYDELEEEAHNEAHDHGDPSCN